MNKADEKDRALYKSYLLSGFDKVMSFYDYKKLIKTQEELEQERKELNEPVGTE